MVDINQTLSTLPDDATLLDVRCPVHDPIQPFVDPKRFETTLSNKPLASEAKRFDLIEMGTPQRPQLEKERSCALFAALLSHVRFEEGQARGLEVFQDEIDFDMREIERREKEFAVLMKEAVKQQRRSSTWSTVGEIVNYLTTSTSLVLGATMAFSGSYLVASALIASAGLGLANLVIRDTVGWDTVAKYFSSVKATQERIEQGMQIGFTVVALGLGLAGSLTQMGQMAQLIDANSVTKIFSTGLQLVSGGTNFASSFENRKFEHIRANQVRLRQELQAKQAASSSKSDDVAEELRRSQTQTNLLQQLVSDQRGLIST